MTKKELEDKMEEELRGLYDRLDIIEMEYENARGEIEEEIEERERRVIEEYTDQFKVGDVVYNWNGKEKYEVMEAGDEGKLKLQNCKGYVYWMDAVDFKKEGEE
jgi:hypothetical protein